MQRELDALYEKAGNCTNQNEAFLLYKKAAEKGHIGAKAKLGMCYYSGFGVEINMNEAEKWLLESAKSGNPEGQYALGCFYFNNGEYSNLDSAVYYLTQAVNQNHSEAVEALNIVMLQVKALRPGEKNSTQLEGTNKKQCPTCKKYNTIYSQKIHNGKQDMLVCLNYGECKNSGFVIDFITGEIISGEICHLCGSKRSYLNSGKWYCYNEKCTGYNKIDKRF